MFMVPMILYSLVFAANSADMVLADSAFGGMTKIERITTAMEHNVEPVDDVYCIDAITGDVPELTLYNLCYTNADNVVYLKVDMKFPIFVDYNGDGGLDALLMEDGRFFRITDVSYRDEMDYERSYDKGIAELCTHFELCSSFSKTIKTTDAQKYPFYDTSNYDYTNER